MFSDSFAERFHLLPRRLRIARLNVREECPSLAGHQSDRQRRIVHFIFKCAYQGPEIDFREGTRLVLVQNAAAHLRHYGRRLRKNGVDLQLRAMRASGLRNPPSGFLCVGMWTALGGWRRSGDGGRAFLRPDEAAVAVLTFTGNRRGVGGELGICWVAARHLKTERHVCPKTCTKCSSPGSY